MTAPIRIAQAAVISLLALGSLAACGSSDTATSTSNGSQGSADSNGNNSNLTFTAGTYSATGQYPTPGGLQGIGVMLTLDEDGTITELEVDPKAEVGNSVQFQGKFAGGIASEVVGKSIMELDVDKVSGSSLTSGGFNRAIEDIVEEAQQ